MQRLSGHGEQTAAAAANMYSAHQRRGREEGQCEGEKRASARAKRGPVRGRTPKGEQKDRGRRRGHSYDGRDGKDDDDGKDVLFS